MKLQVNELKKNSKISISKQVTMVVLMALGSTAMVSAQTTPVKSTPVKTATEKVVTKKTETVKEVKMGMHKEPAKAVQATVETKKTVPTKAKSK